MCEPTTMFLVASVASAAVGAYSQIQAGNAQYKADMYNAQIQERNAQAVENEKKNVQDAAAIERRRLGERVRAERGDKIAAASAMGLDPGFGSPADLIGDIEQAYRGDLAIMGRNEMTELGRLDKEQADYLDSAKMARASGKSALKGSRLGAVGTLLGGAAQVSSKWIAPASPLQVTPQRAPALSQTSIFNPLPVTRVAPPLAIGG